MKVHKFEVVVLDFDELTAEGVRATIENQRYPNHCISPHVLSVETRDIGGWDDDHPLNKKDTFKPELERLFGPGNAGTMDSRDSPAVNKSLTVEQVEKIIKDHLMIQVNFAGIQHDLQAHAGTGFEALKLENENLRSTMVAAAEEIAAHWNAHCDAEGYGPVNLMNRLERGIPAQYAYKAGDFERMRQELEELRAQLAQSNQEASQAGDEQTHVAALTLADWLGGAEQWPSYVPQEAAAELRRLHFAHEHQRAVAGTLLRHAERVQDKAQRLQKTLERCNSLLAELTFSSWIPQADVPSRDIQRRIKTAHEQASQALQAIEAGGSF